VQDVYAAGSKAFWLYHIGYYKKWGNSNHQKYCVFFVILL